MTRVQIEVCVDSPAGAAVARNAGADRVELCSALIVGGLTPSIGCVADALAATGAVPDAGTAAQAAGTDRMGGFAVHVLIRPREGDFVYGRDDVRTMLRDIDAIRREADNASLPVGFVIGALTDRGAVDRAVTAELLAACQDCSTTFHRAFDLTEDLDRSLDVLIELGVDRVLTGGGAQRAVDGLAAVAHLVRRGGDRIAVMAGGSIRPENVVRIVAATDVGEIHFRAPTGRANAPTPRGHLVRMTSTHAPSESVREETSAETVLAMLAELRRRA